MAKAAPFDAHFEHYDAWFDQHHPAYLSELLAVRAFLPYTGRGLEVGVGSGRFAAPLGVPVGLDPSPAMLALAAARGIDVVEGVAEELPFRSGSFDYALVVTTICFVDSPAAMLAEIRRVLKPGGCLVVGFIDRASALGQHYLVHQTESVFYREATFYSASEVEQLLLSSELAVSGWGQTLSQPLRSIRTIEPLRPGCGTCGFVVASAYRTP